MEDVTRACVALLCLILIRSAQTLGSPGIMQMQVEGFYNTHGRDSAGRCCSLPANSTARTPLFCPGTCRTFFRVCAAKVGPNWPDEPDLRQNTLACPLGLLVTPPIANNSLDPQQDGVLIMRFPYREWPGKVKIVLEAWHDVTGSLFEQDPRVSLGAENVARLIMRIERRHRLNLNEDWLRRTVHITVPNGESSRRPVRRISVTYALRIVPIPKPTPPPFTLAATTTEATKENSEMSSVAPEQAETTISTVDNDTERIEEGLNTLKIDLSNETVENESENELMSTVFPPVEMEVTMPHNLAEDSQIMNISSTESELNEDYTDLPDMMTTTSDEEITTAPEIITDLNNIDIFDNDDLADALETPIIDSLRLDNENKDEETVNIEAELSTEMFSNENSVENATEETDASNLPDMTPTTEYLQITTFETNENNITSPDNEKMIDKLATQVNESTESIEQGLVKINIQTNNPESITPSPTSQIQSPTVSNNSTVSKIKTEMKSISGSPKYIFKNSLITYMHDLKLQRSEETPSLN